MVNYISRIIKYCNGVVRIVEMYKDVRVMYESNHMPKYLTIEDKQSEFKVQIQNQCIKMYVTKYMDVVNNIDFVYAKIWGECTYPLQKMINHFDKFTVKHKKRDVIWILKNLMIVSTGIESLCNKRVNFFNALKYFLNIRQVPLEGDNGYIAIFSIETLILAGGPNVLCSPDIMEAAD